MTCPYLTQSDEGTGYCTLAEQAIRYVQNELKMERAWRMRLQEELWALDPSKDPRRPARIDGRADIE